MARSTSLRFSSASLPAVFLALSLQGCGAGGPAGQDGTPAKPPVSAALGTPKALFVGSGTTATGSGTGLQALKAVAQDDSIQDVPFIDDAGAPVAVEVTRVEALSEDYFALELSYANGSGKRALLRKADGKLFDISAYGVAGAQVKGGFLFTIGKDAPYTLYKIDLAATPMTATPLNNPRYDPIASPSLPFLVDADLDLRLEHDAYSTEIFFADNSAPLPEAWNAGGKSTLFCPTGGRGRQLASVYGEDGKVYAFCVRDVPDLVDPLKRYLEYYVATVDFTKGGTVVSDGSVLRQTACVGTVPNNIPCPESTLAPTTPYRLQNRGRYVPLTSGFFTMSPVTGGGLTLTWTANPLPAITVVSGGFGYRRDGDSIKRIAFAPSATEEVVATATGIIDFKVARGVLIFTRYLTGTTIGTYKVTTPGATPELLLSEDMKVQQIIEL